MEAFLELSITDIASLSCSLVSACLFQKDLHNPAAHMTSLRKPHSFIVGCRQAHLLFASQRNITVLDNKEIALSQEGEISGL